MKILDTISEMLQKGKADEVKKLVQQGIDEGINAKIILEDGMMKGMNIIGVKFKNNEVYVPEVLVAARAMNFGIETLKPYMTEHENIAKGKVVLGTVVGDLHNIGKNLVKIMMEGKGLEVIDLGVDVSSEKYIEAIKEHQPQIIGFSALLTTTMINMEKVVATIKEAGLRDKVKIMIGGAPVTEEYCKTIGADIYCSDAASAADAAIDVCAN